MVERHVSRRTLLAGATALASAAPLLAACGEDDPKAPPLLMAAGVDRAEPAPDAPVAATIAGMLVFTQKLVAAVATAGTNWIASPLSIAVCFAMARAGARGATATQLDQMFGFPAHGRDDAFNAVTREIATTDRPPAKDTERDPTKPAPPPIVSLGNALFIEKGLRVAPDFLGTLAAQYGAGARPVDFTSSGAAARINAWVREQTAGRITELFDQLDPQARLVLANTVYFHGFWKVLFELDDRASTPFTRADGRRVPAMMMSQTATVPYAAVDGIQSVDLPYAAGDYAMRLILPPAGARPAGVLDTKTMGSLAAAMRQRPATVKVPRFDFRTGVDLGTVLPAMGLAAPFDPNQADFSGIAPGLFVKQAVHRATITVNEDGTVAAAATGVAMSPAFRGPDPEVTFVADRPFAVMIVGGKDRVPLFVGQVNDPTAK